MGVEGTAPLTAGAEHPFTSTATNARAAKFLDIFLMIWDQ
jgi:hypothetical protein